jgi:hypothetical protein
MNDFKVGGEFTNENIGAVHYRNRADLPDLVTQSIETPRVPRHLPKTQTRSQLIGITT